MKNSVKQLILTALFLCINSAAGLQCLVCDDSRCSSQSTVNCNWGENLCYTQLTEDSFTRQNRTYTWMYKGCASAQRCPTTGSHYVSLNIGTESHLFNTTCCDTDNCNTDNSTVSPPAGSLQCYGCDPWSYECTANVTCNAMETCFKSLRDDGRPHYGCVSENECNGNHSGRYFSPSTSLSCCNTSHCNAPAPSLQCLVCADSRCSSQRSVNCWGANLCYSQVTEDPFNLDTARINKGCASAQECTTTGSHYDSLNIGNRPQFSNITCCDTDNCNTDNSTVSPPAGSLQCYGCDPWSYECTANVTCNAMETCFKSLTVDGHPRHYGCVSENQCNGNRSRYLSPTTSVSCCNTSHCNAPGNQCMTCSDDTCSSQSTTICSTNRCIAYAHPGSFNSSSPPRIIKGCAPTNLCPVLGSHFISYQLGNNILSVNITCCDGNNCNTAEPSFAPSAGSLQCYSCDLVNPVCTNVTCNAQEVCSQTTIWGRRYYGCVSTNLCNNSNISSIVFGFKEEISCCNTTNCNNKYNPSSTHDPPNATKTPDKGECDDRVEVCSLLDSAVPLLPLGLPLSLLGLYASIPHF